MTQCRERAVAMARDVLLRQEEWKDLWRKAWKDLWKKAWARNQDNGTTQNTPGPVANITRCLQRMEATWEDAFTISVKDNKKISLIKGEHRKFKHDLGEALMDARLRLITRKDLMADAAKGTDNAAFLRLLRSRQLTHWQWGQLRALHMNGV